MEARKLATILLYHGAMSVVHVEMRKRIMRLEVHIQLVEAIENLSEFLEAVLNFQ